VYMVPLDSDAVDLCKAIDVPGIVTNKKEFVMKSDGTKEAITLLTKGLLQA